MKFSQTSSLARESPIIQNAQDGKPKKTAWLAMLSNNGLIQSLGQRKVRSSASTVEDTTLVEPQAVAPDVQDTTALQNEPTVKGVALRLHGRFFPGWEMLVIAAVLLIAGLAHGINMLHYPYFEDDEGTYMSQAAAVIHIGKLAYYTYWYDHAPVGWLQIAAWLALTGGDHTFGSIIFSGRILMLLMQLGSTFMVYYIARKVSGNVLVAVVAALLFALSPYGLYFHRRVLLDNVTTFWLLITLLVLTTKRITLNRIWISAATLCISILSKEITAFVVPVMAYLVYTRADKSHRWFALIGWLVLVGVLISLYPLMAVLNNELFPTGTLLGGNAPHVSLLGSLLYQGSRGKDGGLFDLNSNFWVITKVWIQDDPILVIFGTISAIGSVLCLKKQRLVGIIGLLTLSLWLFLGRGGEVIKFYLVPLLPLLALNLAFMLGLLGKAISTVLQRQFHYNKTILRTVEQIVIFACIAAIVFSIPPPSAGYDYGSSDISNSHNPLIFWNGTQADAQDMATSWIKDNVSPKSRILIDEYMWSDLHDDGYAYAHYYWKVQTDPAIRDTLFHDNWRNFDYVATTSQMLVDMQTQNMTLVKDVIDNSTPVAHFDTGGWRVEIRKVNK